MIDTELTIPFDFTEIRLLQELVEAALNASSFADHNIFSIKLAFEEALVSALKNGVSIKPALEAVVGAIERGNRMGPNG